MPEQPLIDQFQTDIENVISKYCDSGLTLGECIGVLEICKYTALKNDDEEQDA